MKIDAGRCVHTAAITFLACRRRKVNGPDLHFKPAAGCKFLGPAVILLLSVGAYINPDGLDTSPTVASWEEK